MDTCHGSIHCVSGLEISYQTRAPTFYHSKNLCTDDFTDEEDPDGETPYEWAVILGGTNDLGRGRLSGDIYKALKEVWSIPLQNGTKVLALTVPECGVCSPVLDNRRDALNSKIKAYQADNLYVYRLPFSVLNGMACTPTRRNGKG